MTKTLKKIEKAVILEAAGNPVRTKDGEVQKTEKPNFQPQEGLKEKFCKIHNRMEPIEGFGKDRWMKDGYANYCKEGYRLRWVVKDPKFAGKKYINPSKS